VQQCKCTIKSFDFVKIMGKISENPYKIPENMCKNGAQKNMKSFCFGSRSFFLGMFGRSWAKILRIPKNLPVPCCTTTDIGIF